MLIRTGYLGTFIQGLLQFCLLYFLPLFYEGVKGYNTIDSGVALLPQCLGSGPATIIAGLLIAKTHLAKPFSLMGWLLFSYGILELTLLDDRTSVYQFIILNIPSGLGLGILSLRFRPQRKLLPRTGQPAHRMSDNASKPWQQA